MLPCTFAGEDRELTDKLMEAGIGAIPFVHPASLLTPYSLQSTGNGRLRRGIEPIDSVQCKMVAENIVVAVILATFLF